MRMLDYWVESGVIEPSRYLETDRRGRTIYLFSFEDIVRIQLVKSLRNSGISLQQIRSVISRLRGHRGKAWQASWLITDGKKIYVPTDDPTIVESLVKGEAGQLAFAIVAVGPIKQLVHQRLNMRDPVDLSRYDATLKRWKEHSLSA